MIVVCCVNNSRLNQARALTMSVAVSPASAALPEVTVLTHEGCVTGSEGDWGGSNVAASEPITDVGTVEGGNKKAFL
jgi:hypothetical protein